MLSEREKMKQHWLKKEGNPALVIFFTTGHDPSINRAFKNSNYNFVVCNDYRSINAIQNESTKKSA